MSGSEEDEVDLLLAYSGSEYEPSSSGDFSDLSTAPSSDDEHSESDSGGANKRQKKGRNKDRKRRKLTRQNHRRNHGNINSPSSSTHQVSFKQFGEFMQGVVFTLSGFVNPMRSELRSKALEMGAQYRPDWDPSCTHLICAFRNTPKYDQVRGKGKIVKKEWIEDSYSSRKRFPWRRYCLDRRDANQSESEGEIHEVSCTNNAAATVNSSDEPQVDSTTD